MRQSGIFTAIIICLVCLAVVRAEIPTTINYQGRLTDEEGAPVPDGKYTLSLLNKNGESTPAYKADLRELELKAKQAKIEAHEAYIKQLEAERELERAKKQQ